MEINQALSFIRAIPDYPSPGILFQDITPLLANADALRAATESLAAFDTQANIVAGIEARGFILGTALSLHKNVGFIPVRKKGKLPYTTISRKYGLEYGTDEIEIHTDALNNSHQVLLVDDVLATGGTLEAAIHLIQETGAKVSSIVVLLEIMALEGRSRLAREFPDITIHSLVTA
jgi:adenine phosphoribosyltransferase